jgi:hypothetical protein
MKALHHLAELAVAFLIGWATIALIQALQPGPWIVPEYGYWTE